MLEAQGAQSAGGGQYDVTLHLKSEVSQLSGQNSELRSRLHQCEAELKTAVRLAERRDCEVNKKLLYQHIVYMNLLFIGEKSNSFTVIPY